jgi:hypothetical protein
VEKVHLTKGGYMQSNNLSRDGGRTIENEKITETSDNEENERLSVSHYIISARSEKTPLVLGIKLAGFTRQDVERLFSSNKTN